MKRRAVLIGVLCLLAWAVVGAQAVAKPRVSPTAVGLPPGVEVPEWVTNDNIYFYPSTRAFKHGKGQLEDESPIFAEEPSGSFSPESRCTFSNGCGPLVYSEKGGAVQHSPHVYLILWGSNWNTGAGLNAKNQILEFFNALSGSSYSKLLTQYFDETGRISSTVALTSYVDTSVTAPTAVTSSKLLTEIGSAVSANGWPTGERDSQFLIIPAPGSTYNQYFADGTFCAYHSIVSVSGKSSPYDFVPYVGDAPFATMGCMGGTSTVAEATIHATSHEYAETATNPFPTQSSWKGPGPGPAELADICGETGALANGQPVNDLWSDHQNGCSDSDPNPPHVYALTGRPDYRETGATLIASVNPEGLATTYKFEYGTEPGKYTNTVGAGELKAGSLETSEVEYSLTGLQPETDYYYRVVASNSTGTVYGLESRFKTSAWQLRTAPPEAPIDMHDVSCVDLDFCVGVGWGDVTYSGEKIVDGSYVLEMGITRWFRPAEFPSDPVTGTSPTLEGISCVAERWCLSVGRYGTTSVRPFARTRSKYGEWSSVVEPAKPADAAEPWNIELSDVSCLSSSSCIAVGSYKAKPVKSGESAPTRTLVEEWSGSNWQVKSSPSVNAFSKLNSVSCVSISICTAVGSSTEGTTTKSLAIRLESGTWSLQSSPNPSGAATTVLEDVSCATSGACLAVGKANDEAKEGIAMSWTSGGGWTLSQPLGGPVFGVSCAVANACISVGVSGSADGQSESWNGSTWSIHNPGLGEKSRSVLHGVSCTMTSICSAVGNFENENSIGGFLQPQPEVLRMPTLAPTATTEAVVDTNTLEPTLRGTVNPNGYDTSYYFEYGTSKQYSGHVPIINNAWAERSVGAGTSPVAVSEALPKLEPSTTYHFRIVATNGEGVVKYGADMTFTTPQPTALCKASEGPCTEANRYAAGTKLSASLKTGTNLKIVSPFGNVTCTASSLEGEVTGSGGSGKMVTADFPTASLSGCTGGAVTVEATPWKSQINTTETVGNGEQKFTSMTIKVVQGGLTCIYGQGTLKVKGGSEAELLAEGATLTTLSGSDTFCPASVPLTATYVVKSPAPLYVSSPAPIDNAVLCKTSEEPCAEANRYAAGTKVSASLKSGTNLKISTATFGTTTCTSSSLEGEVTDAGGIGKAAAANLATASFGGCTGGTVSAEGFPWSSSINRTEGLGSGQQTFTNMAIKVVQAGITCVYGGKVTLNVKGAGEAELLAGGITLAKQGGDAFCPSSATLTATYVVKSPAPLYVSWP